MLRRGAEILLRLTVGIPLALLMLFTMPVWGPLLLVAIWTELAYLPGELRFRSRMRRAGRWLPRADFIGHLREGTGTVIVEWPSRNLTLSRAWWTPEVIEMPWTREPIDLSSCVYSDYPEVFDLSLAPEADLHRAVSFANRCRERYTHPERGQALLASVWHGEHVVWQLGRTSSSIRIIYWSWRGVFWRVGKGERAGLTAM
jgi:hypothetical protein